MIYLSFVLWLLFFWPCFELVDYLKWLSNGKVVKEESVTGVVYAIVLNALYIGVALALISEI